MKTLDRRGGKESVLTQFKKIEERENWATLNKINIYVERQKCMGTANFKLRSIEYSPEDIFWQFSKLHNHNKTFGYCV